MAIFDSPKLICIRLALHFQEQHAVFCNQKRRKEQLRGFPAGPGLKGLTRDRQYYVHVVNFSQMQDNFWFIKEIKHTNCIHLRRDGKSSSGREQCVLGLLGHGLAQVGGRAMGRIPLTLHATTFQKLIHLMLQATTEDTIIPTL